MKTANKTSISVFISAYNEKRNIGRVLLEILRQKQKNWYFKEITVYCDGCTDGTDEIVKQLALANKTIKLRVSKQRKGKIERLNSAFKAFRGDYLVLFDADITLMNNLVIHHLLCQLKNPKTMIVGANSLCFKPVTFFERSVYSALSVYYDSRKYLNGGHNAFGCTGAGMLLRREFAKSLQIPDILMNEDCYIYLQCIKKGYVFRLAQKSVVYYRIPGNLKDYLKQVFRSTPESVKQMLNKKFGTLVTREYDRPLPFYLKSVIKSIIRDPLPSVYMIIIRLFCKPFFFIFSNNYKLKWFRSESTK